MEMDAADTNAKDARKSALSDPCLIYSPREDATPEGEIVALAAIYKVILQSHDERKKSSRYESEGEVARSSSSQEQYPVAGHDDD